MLYALLFKYAMDVIDTLSIVVKLRSMSYSSFHEKGYPCWDGLFMMPHARNPVGTRDWGINAR